jgi:hypothetical protein
LVEIEEGAGASISPKVATAEVSGAGRNRQAAATIQIASGIDEGEKVSVWGLGWVG